MPLIKNPVILPEDALPGFYIPQAGSSFQHKRKMVGEKYP
jgi:hypothetical protein